jgi:hypothetical protein
LFQCLKYHNRIIKEKKPTYELDRFNVKTKAIEYTYQTKQCDTKNRKTT